MTSPKSLLIDCPCCGYKNALSMTERDDRTLYYCHAGCPQSALLAAIRGEQWKCESSWYDRPKPIVNQNTRDYVLQLLNTSKPAENTLAEKYLRGRGIVRQIPYSIRFLARHRHTETDEHYPVMLAAVNDIEGRAQAVHRTFLAHDGKGKAPVTPVKKTLAPIDGYACHLAPAGETLAVTEGIETGLSVMQVSSIPTWAALSAGGISNLILPPLPLAIEVIICADNDDGGVGLRAAENAALRWRREGRVWGDNALNLYVAKSLS